ncbi:hypothetical protein [Rufibacter psychrotolerans]|uniref:hypothetical protein n=1 Tax=Rufibacter psychrotolerans TaxID=2812556 RepID=UPI0019674500|nr:hypothetical protein [Rufibacter sp. SYSU D00308]
MIELSQECIQTLQGILEEWEECTGNSPEEITASLESIQKTGHILNQLQTQPAEGSQAAQRLSLLAKMLDQAKEEVAGGNLQDGLWYGKSVISFLLNGTSAGTVPLAPVEFS